MHVHDEGVKPGSTHYLHRYAPPQEENPLAFYALVVGEYFCTPLYRVDRNRLDSFLLMYVVSGTGYVYHEDVRYDLTTGSIALLDCYRPHHYGTTQEMHIQWLHFDGPMARSYFQRATQHGPVLNILHHYPATHKLRKILHTFQEGKPISELLFSKWVNDLMTDIIQDMQETYGGDQPLAVIDESVRYISQHLDQEISIPHLAAQAGLSPYYFSRLFKQETGVSPHQYLITVRLEYSCFLLRSTPLSVKEIAVRCGFRSQSNYCTRFRSVYQCTPQEFRSSS